MTESAELRTREWESGVPGIDWERLLDDRKKRLAVLLLELVFELA